MLARQMEPCANQQMQACANERCCRMADPEGRFQGYCCGACKKRVENDFTGRRHGRRCLGLPMLRQTLRQNDLSMPSTPVHAAPAMDTPPTKAPRLGIPIKARPTEPAPDMQAPVAKGSVLLAASNARAHYGRDGDHAHAERGFKVISSIKRRAAGTASKFKVCVNVMVPSHVHMQRRIQKHLPAHTLGSLITIRLPIGCTALKLSNV